MMDDRRWTTDRVGIQPRWMDEQDGSNHNTNSTKYGIRNTKYLVLRPTRARHYLSKCKTWMFQLRDLEVL